jgi:hypothetical protein
MRSFVASTPLPMKVPNKTKKNGRYYIVDDKSIRIEKADKNQDKEYKWKKYTVQTRIQSDLLFFQCHLVLVVNQEKQKLYYCKIIHSKFNTNVVPGISTNTGRLSFIVGV